LKRRGLIFEDSLPNNNNNNNNNINNNNINNNNNNNNNNNKNNINKMSSDMILVPDPNIENYFELSAFF